MRRCASAALDTGIHPVDHGKQPRLREARQHLGAELGGQRGLLPPRRRARSTVPNSRARRAISARRSISARLPPRHAQPRRARPPTAIAAWLRARYGAPTRSRITSAPSPSVSLLTARSHAPLPLAGPRQDRCRRPVATWRAVREVPIVSAPARRASCTAAVPHPRSPPHAPAASRRALVPPAGRSAS